MQYIQKKLIHKIDKFPLFIIVKENLLFLTTEIPNYLKVAKLMRLALKLILPSILLVIQWGTLLTLLYFFKNDEINSYGYPVNVILNISIVCASFLLLGMEISSRHDTSPGLTLNFIFSVSNISKSFSIIGIYLFLEFITEYFLGSADTRGLSLWIEFLLMFLHIMLSSFIVDVIIYFINTKNIPPKLKNLPNLSVIAIFISITSVFIIDMGDIDIFPDYVEIFSVKSSKIIRHKSFDYAIDYL